MNFMACKAKLKLGTYDGVGPPKKSKTPPRPWCQQKKLFNFLRGQLNRLCLGLTDYCGFFGMHMGGYGVGAGWCV